MADLVKIAEQFADIWECEIDHPKFQDKVSEIVEKTVEMVEQERRWIPVSERLPEEQETIFAKFKGTDKWSPAMFAQSSEDVRVVIVFADGTRRVSTRSIAAGCAKSCRSWRKPVMRQPIVIAR